MVVEVLAVALVAVVVMATAAAMVEMEASVVRTVDAADVVVEVSHSHHGEYEGAYCLSI